MKNNKALWDTIWKIVKFILTLGLSHIDKRNKSNSQDNNLYK